VNDGIVSADSQRAHARFELAGDVSDYARAAKRALALGGRFVFCFPTVQRVRAERACEAAGLAIITMCDVIPKAGVPALFSLFACEGAAEGARAAPIVEPPFVVRDERGFHTREMTAARAVFGMGEGAEFTAPSPSET
jgi:tRNA1(Val) A37 N6-methylase TrmN6